MLIITVRTSNDQSPPRACKRPLPFVVKRAFASTRTFFILPVILFLLLTLCPPAWAWPTDSDWIAVPRGFTYLSDPQADAIGNDARDIVGDATHPVAYVFNDGNFVYYRMRVDKDPRTDPVVGEFRPFGWGFLVDTNGSSDDYEFMVMIDGIANPEVMYLAKNTQQGIIGDASDKAELVLWQESLSYNVNYRVLYAGTVFPAGAPTEDFFVDWRIPFDAFKSSLGVSDSSLIRYFVGSANNAMVLNADLCEGSGNTSLSLGLSNFVLPSGVQPVTGSIAFVANAAGTVDLTEFTVGATIYLKVVDPDRNNIASEVQTLSIKMTAPSGDIEQTVILTETGPNTGIFIGPLNTAEGTKSDNDGTLQTMPVEIITATYLDAADGSTPTLFDQPRTDTARVLPAADLAVSKSVSNETPNEGDNIDYTVSVLNHGPSAASGIQITDLLPSGVTYVSHSAPSGTSYNQITGLWSAGSLALNASKSLTITAKINSGTAQTTITNTATRTAAAQPDPVSANNSASAPLSVTGADVALTKTVSNPTPSSGATVRFTITVRNDGAYAATNLVVTDLLPAATWSSIALVSATHGSWNYAAGTGTWSVGTLPYPGNATLIIDATLSAGVASGTTVVNSAFISQMDQKDPHPADDSASATLVVGGIDLALSKSVTSPNPATPNVGDTVTFAVTVSNSALASTTATGVEVTDLLPAGLTYLSSSSNPVGLTYAQGNGKWSVGSLAPGASATLTLNATVSTGTGAQTLTNTAAISAYNQVDVNLGNHSASAGVSVKATDLRIIKTASNATPANNTDISYFIDVTNVSTTAASSVTIFDLLPGAVLYQSSSATQGSYSTATSLWSVGSLAAGATARLTITVRVNLGSNDPKTFFNTAALQASTPADNNSTNNVSTQVVSVSGTDLGLTKVMAAGYSNYPNSGTATRFLITLTNRGPNTATGIVVKDLLPAGLSCDSATVSTGNFTNTGGKCDWSIASFASGASATMTLISTVSAANGSIITNRATINAVDQADPDSANNTGSQILYVGASDLSISKSVDNATPNIGNTVKFTVTVTNNGVNNVGGIQVTDLLPNGLNFVSAAPSVGSITSAPAVGSPGNIVWSVGTLSYSAGPPVAKGSATLVVTATIASGTEGTVLTNEARITAAGSLDPDSANNQTTQSVTVQMADVYVNKEANTLTPYVNETVTFTVTAGNNGPFSATNLVIRDLLRSTPDASGTPNPVFSGLISTPSQGSYNAATGDWSVGTLAKGSIATLTLTATVNSGAENQNVSNSASRLSVDQSDTNSNNNSQTVTLTPKLLTVDLRLTKSVNTPTPVEGNNVVFTLTLYNLHGSRAGSGIVVTDTLPAGLTFVSATPSSGSISAAPVVGNAGNVVWNVPSLSAMNNATLTIVATTACGTSGALLTNSATINAHDQVDPDSSNNSATASVTPTTAPPSLTIVKMADTATAIPGQIITYTIQTLNSGCGIAKNITLDDYMSPLTSWSLHAFGVDTPFLFTDSSPASGLTLGTPVYSNDHGVTLPYAYAPTSKAGNAPDGYDATVTNWQIPMNGILRSGGSFTLKYKVQIK